MPKVPPTRISLGPSTVEEIICATKGTGLFTDMMKLAVGLAIGTDGIEVTLLSYLVPCVAAEWDLTEIQQGSLTASVFAGELAGALVLGLVSDHFGRRPGFQLATVLVVAFGILTVFAPGFWWLLLFRTMVGVGAGGMEVPFDLLSEVIPRKERSRILVDVQVTWALGSLFVGIVAWAVLSFGFSWRWMALIAALPPLAVLCCFSFIPESPRWLIANGREGEARGVLRDIAKRNRVELTSVIIFPEESPKGKESGVRGLWRRPELRKRSFVSCTVWASFGFLYYGIILLSSKVMGDSGSCSFDYSILFFACSSELIANVATRFYVNKLDRRLSLAINFTISGLMTALMPIKGALAWLLITSFFARGTAYVAACFSWVITPELYPTEVRSTGHAISNSFARLGAIGASYWVASSVGNTGIALVLMMVGVVGAMASQVLPSDRRQELNDSQREEADAESRPLLWEPRTGTM